MLFRISYIIVGNVTILIAEKHHGFIQVGNVIRLIVDVKRSERHLTVLFD